MNSFYFIRTSRMKLNGVAKLLFGDHFTVDIHFIVTALLYRKSTLFWMSCANSAFLLTGTGKEILFTCRIVKGT